MNNTQIIRNLVTVTERIGVLESILQERGVDIPVATNGNKQTDATEQIKLLKHDIANIKKQQEDIKLKLDRPPVAPAPVAPAPIIAPPSTPAPSPVVSPTSDSNLNSVFELVTTMRQEIDMIKRKIPFTANDVVILKQNIDSMKSVHDSIAGLKTELQAIKIRIAKLDRNEAVNPVNQPNTKDIVNFKQELSDMKKQCKDMEEIDIIIKNNFNVTNQKFQTVNEAVTSLNNNIKKFNEIEGTVQQLSEQISKVSTSSYDESKFKNQMETLKKELNKKVEEVSKVGPVNVAAPDINSDVVKTLKNEIETFKKELNKKIEDIAKVNPTTGSANVPPSDANSNNDALIELKKQMETFKTEMTKKVEEVSKAGPANVPPSDANSNNDALTELKKQMETFKTEMTKKVEEVSKTGPPSDSSNNDTLTELKKQIDSLKTDITKTQPNTRTIKTYVDPQFQQIMKRISNIESVIKK